MNFKERFQGKTSKISKEGVTGLFNISQNPNFKTNRLILYNK